MSALVLLLVTLGVGAIAGFLAQRSRLCFVGGLRDFLLIGDTALLKGAVAFFLAAWLMFPLASLLGGSVWQLDEARPAAAVTSELAGPEGGPTAGSQPAPFGAEQAPFRPWLPATVAVVAGTGLGVVSVLANGCPLRQHVVAAQGAGDSFYYLGGFYVGAVVYHTAVQPWLSQLIP